METEGYSSDKLGIKFTKKRPDLYLLDVEMFADAIQWLCRVLRSDGYRPVRAELDPYLNRWHFYDAGDVHIFTAPHDLVDHIWELRTGHVYEPS